MEEAGRDLVGLSDYVTERTRRRLEGLSGDEYGWEPVPLCWSVRPATGGGHRADTAPWPSSPPFTTLSWRLWHLTCCYGQSRNARLLGRPVDAGARFETHTDAPATAADAIAAFDDATGHWRGLLGSLTDDDLAQPMGPVAGQYAEQKRSGFVLHMIDEFIHHGAEVGVLRDLYRARASAAGSDMLVLALLEGDRAQVDGLTAAAPGRLAALRAARPDLVITAVRSGWWRAVPLLVDLGFPVPDEPDGDTGATPLHWAAGSGRVDVVDLLLDLGADPSRTDARFGADARGWAGFYGHQEVVDLLERRLSGGT